ncbi:MAG: geranylgeranyl reductase family protein [Mycobacterium leprae]
MSLPGSLSAESAAVGAPGRADADVVVVGAGPAGSTTAFWLARAGVDVLLLEKATFPREKVCGDGLTPRAVRQLVAMGVDTTPDAGWLRNKGLRIIGGGMRLHMAWPELASFPDYGLVRPRADLDELLVRAAVTAGARLRERTTVTGPVVDERSGRVVGVTARADDGAPLTVRAQLVVAADGNSSRLSLACGLPRREDRPMGVAVRRYYRSPRHDDDWLESWLELWDGRPGASRLLPGYGWVFGMGDGTSNVGLGILNTSPAFGSVGYRTLLRRWLSGVPEEWGLVEANATGPARGSALPMGFNRTPHYTRGLLLVGDAGGMVNPFNGEGIAYAMEAGQLATDVVAQALARREGPARERALSAYPQALRDTYGGYFAMGRIFVRLIGSSTVMKLATRHGLPHPTLMRFVHKLLANLTDRTDGDVMDRVVTAMTRLAPAGA